MTHTKGPWVMHSGMVWKDGTNVYPNGEEDGVPIARMDREAGNGTTPTERDANARLIAAAPPAAPALREYMNVLVLPDPGYERQLVEAIEAARETILKAEGR